MNYDQFFESIESNEISIEVGEKSHHKSYQLSNEALFQLPLISLIVLLLSKDRRKPVVTELGQLVGESIEDCMAGFKGSSQLLGWSANLRIRTVKAISFLERSGLVIIRSDDNRIAATPLGIKVVNKALSGDDYLSYALSLIQRSYRNICINRQFDMELI
ncbi:hypothetical protein [Pseudomonas sp. BN411]|uniref:hypothetical protein n=1 Tax=Pseudomonas sp. BN411 TaxID=2567887 RepID=UPI002455AE63|nr:hypothetical protein [Pseudomonas sp. BN411]MDH4560785.1 hypothetical protein [Pseudomonas sp. BN411]